MITFQIGKWLVVGLMGGLVIGGYFLYAKVWVKWEGDE